MILVLEQGAHYVVNHKAPDHCEEVVSLNSGRGVDVILEMLANVNLGNDLKNSGPGRPGCCDRQPGDCGD